MHVDYLKQPVLSQNLVELIVTPGSLGTMSVDASGILVSYPFAEFVARDSLGNLPAAVSPDPYVDWTSSAISKATFSLGTATLSNSLGTLTSETAGKLDVGQSLTLKCPAWSVER